MAPSEDVTVAMKTIEKELEKVKFKSFGKVKLGKSAKVSQEVKTLNKEKACIIKNGNAEELSEVNKKLTVNYLQEQREDLEKGFKSLKETWKTKGRSASIFKLKEIVVGPKKPQQEPTSIKDTESKKEIFDVEKIRNKSLEYCVNLLTNRAPREGYAQYIKSKNAIHEYRMNVRDPDDEMEYSVDMFKNALEKLKKDGNKKYEFILKPGVDQ